MNSPSSFRSRRARRFTSSRQRGMLGGVSLGRLYPGVDALENGLVVAVTETATDEDIAALEAGLKEVCAVTVNPSGWRPSAPANEQGEPQTVTGNRALMLEEPLIFEIGSIDQTGVDFPDVRSRTRAVSAGWSATAPIGLAGPQRAGGGAPLHAPVAAELRDRPRPFPARVVHDEAQSAPQREGRAAAGLRRHPSAAAAGNGAGRAGADQPARLLAARPHGHARRGDEPQGRARMASCAACSASAPRSRRAATRARSSWSPKARTAPIRRRRPSPAIASRTFRPTRRAGSTSKR